MRVGSRGLAALLVVASLGTACGDGDGIVRTPRLAAPKAEVVEFTAETVELSGFAFGSGDIAVVLAHMQNGAKEDWIDVAVALAENGVMSFTFDFRGYGGQEGELDRKVASDVTAAVEAMRERGASRVYVVGASMGAAAALVAAAREDLAGVVSVSSPARFPGLKIRQAATQIDEPVLFVAAEDDQPYAQAAQKLAAAAAGELTMYEGAEHGTDILTGDHGDELTALIIGFVTDQQDPVEPTAASGAATGPAAEDAAPASSDAAPASSDAAPASSEDAPPPLAPAPS